MAAHVARRDIEEKRLCVHVWRTLRTRAAALERRGQEGPATVSVRELVEAFPDLSEPVLRTRLKDRCGCVPHRVRRPSPRRVQVANSSIMTMI